MALSINPSYVPYSNYTNPEAEDASTVIRNPGESTEKQAGRQSSPAECKTCKERKYQDGSDEEVSLKP